MGTRYHYDRHGNYKGKTSDEPPSNNDGCLVVFILFVILCCMFGGC